MERNTIKRKNSIKNTREKCERESEVKKKNRKSFINKKNEEYKQIQQDSRHPYSCCSTIQFNRIRSLRVCLCAVIATKITMQKKIKREKMPNAKEKE